LFVRLSLILPTYSRKDKTKNMHFLI
jgi:hypothetical protein